MKIWLLLLVFIATTPSGLFAGDYAPFSSLNGFRHELEQADYVAIVDVKEGGGVDPWLIFRSTALYPLNTLRFGSGSHPAGRYLYIETFSKSDSFHSYWGQSVETKSTTISLPKGCLTLLDGRRLYIPDLIGLISNARANFL